MSHPNITRATETIHNPDDPRHFMRVKPIPGTVRIFCGGRVLAESNAALRVTEVAGDVLDPMIYFPSEDVRAALEAVEGKTTHCPLKGDASYFALEGAQPIAWSYGAPFGFANQIAGYIAFYPDEVIVEETGPNA